MRRLVYLAILTSSTAVFADDDLLSPGRDPVGEPDGYVAAGASTGKDKFQFEAFTLESGNRISRLPLFARIMGAAGNTKLDTAPGTGTFVEARVGLEGRTCINNGMLCGSLGVDVGAHRGRFDQIPVGPSKPAVTMPPPAADNSVFDTMLIAPRLTVDGGARVRMRGVLEIPTHSRQGETVTGYAISLAIGVGF